MRFLIIGLGIYGYNLARNLTDMGHEVIGADNCKANIEQIKDYISTVYLIDATEEASLAMLPLNNVDLVIVAIGENFGASIKVVAMLKKMKVKHIYARAIDPLHESILQGFDIDRILTPEQRAARDLTNELAIGTRVLALSIDDNTYILKFALPAKLAGRTYRDIGLKRHGLELVAVTRPVETVNVLGIKRRESRVVADLDLDEVAREGDTLTCMGTRKQYYSFYKQVNTL